ncbi:MAG: lactam utilization protein LamB [Spirochaetes bacterium GWD1_61_31]|nr:MAG: lactam utilization protein LamB [Spirochaetes bacterium GWB1_60_80]OHD30727.1 MAG: lactam utilization protein LamB [Spirochaetes bacterium GWC1_61_12]OHD42382.1 MAG: lactam utilization protein LamB [Spirochaetes bacterium GWD1_61_31]OHD42677.1 MAG: lactam utilization protein LamB [Spirochaetes bacterium GWE1_60_18]OHD58558.1 MAG: lactam utilization protein LamB [Spirochaetes bacterium GWF1_60_12]HAP43844.1 LamB/YcsF family protein [Spirochaetaceae bacterium]
MTTIDLNADLGESFGAWTMGHDEALLACVSSANLACGVHAGDPSVMAHSVAAAIRAGVAIGAHPGYPDLIGFGRRSLAMTADEVYTTVLYQLGALQAFVRAAGGRLVHVKPHGALYNDAALDPTLAEAIARATRAADHGLRLVGLPGSALEMAAAGLDFWGEFFADRAYDDAGRLLPRTQPGALLHDRAQVIARTRRAVASGDVETAGGGLIKLRFRTICLHGDNPAAVELAQALRASLEAGGVTVTAGSATASGPSASGPTA